MMCDILLSFWHFQVEESSRCCSADGRPINEDASFLRTVLALLLTSCPKVKLASYLKIIGDALILFGEVTHGSMMELASSLFEVVLCLEDDLNYGDTSIVGRIKVELLTHSFIVKNCMALIVGNSLMALLEASLKYFGTLLFICEGITRHIGIYVGCTGVLTEGNCRIPQRRHERTGDVRYEQGNGKLEWV